MKVASILAAGSLFVAGAAVAQDATPPAAGGQAQAAPEAAPAPATDPAPVSDAEVDRFALAALMIEQISTDEALDQQQKQASMAAAVQKIGLEPQRFNEIATAVQADQALNERVQVAAARHVEAAQEKSQ